MTSQYKILEQNGVDNENVDGAEFNNFCSGGRDGIFKGVLNECAVFKINSNTVAVSTGEMLIHGVRIKLKEVKSFTLSSVPVAPIRYQIIADLRLTPLKDVEFSIRYQVLDENLVQEEIFKEETGHYQAEIARFTHSPTGGIEDVIRTLHIIKCGASGIVNVGNVTTQTLAPEEAARVIVKNKYDVALEDYITDFDFEIPQGKQGNKGDNLYSFELKNGHLYVSSAIADENKMKLVNGHIMFGD